MSLFISYLKLSKVYTSVKTVDISSNMNKQLFERRHDVLGVCLLTQMSNRTRLENSLITVDVGKQIESESRFVWQNIIIYFSEHIFVHREISNSKKKSKVHT